MLGSASFGARFAFPRQLDPILTPILGPSQTLASPTALPQADAAVSSSPAVPSRIERAALAARAP
jgi:hypothetical protein